MLLCTRPTGQGRLSSAFSFLNLYICSLLPSFHLFFSNYVLADLRSRSAMLGHIVHQVGATCPISCSGGGGGHWLRQTLQHSGLATSFPQFGRQHPGTACNLSDSSFVSPLKLIYTAEAANVTHPPCFPSCLGLSNYVFSTLVVHLSSASCFFPTTCLPKCILPPIFNYDMKVPKRYKSCFTFV